MTAATEVPDLESRVGDEEALWEELWTYTGDGHGQHLDAIYEVTIIEAAVPELVGLSQEFG